MKKQDENKFVNLEWKVLKFDQLTLDQLYNLLQLRSQIFVVEQDCVYLDMDGKDRKALHVLGFKGNKICAYARLFDKGEYFDACSIGRVIVAEDERRYAYGHNLMSESIKAIKEYYGEDIIKISAQKYLKKFYEAHGFIQKGEGYLEDGIPHIEMYKAL
ncbi:GNAT family N-acetyltransferase [Ancylomarina sp. 16SWW S1-10-2]|uniref:GNAT family N-acetyltransferase n=1 Tax=Ancylomarina sp. 16SWW S1-10-2 TaxID=2499681 RepID=UPI0012AEA731|nr:GNAT family N-acetyltransferase [Ancylomarina sp. 16SWW S1-10-2]MRT93486.1 GNAT family N-acetyltransferase [Ancylomarina sp. 16SWW S1-10-2]